MFPNDDVHMASLPPRILTDAQIAARLQELLASMPAIDARDVVTAELARWSGHCVAVMEQYEIANHAPVPFAAHASQISADLLRGMAVSHMLQRMHAALATLELKRNAEGDGVAGAMSAGQTYDVFKRLNHYLDRAQTAAMIVDPYLDEVVVDDYLRGMRARVPIRLLTAPFRQDYTARLTASLKHAIPQYGLQVELRHSRALHDRLVFLDSLDECLVMGSSIRTAGKKSPTYLAMLDGEIGNLKRNIYDQIWNAATPIPIP